MAARWKTSTDGSAPGSPKHSPMGRLAGGTPWLSIAALPKDTPSGSPSTDTGAGRVRKAGNVGPASAGVLVGVEVGIGVAVGVLVGIGVAVAVLVGIGVGVGRVVGISVGRVVGIKVGAGVGRVVGVGDGADGVLVGVGRAVGTGLVGVAVGSGLVRRVVSTVVVADG